MNASCKGLNARSWKDLYQAAIFESDLGKLPERIADAEVALVVSARQLFYAADADGQEAESLDHAMCILPPQCLETEPDRYSTEPERRELLARSRGSLVYGTEN